MPCDLRSAPNNRQRLICLLFLFAVAFEVTNAQESTAFQNPQIANHYRIDNDNSWVHVLVYRAGLLRALGHNHVIASKHISGFIHLPPDPAEWHLSLRLSLADFVIDDSETRELLGDDFTKPVSAADQEATLANMLGAKLLRADQYPAIRIESESISGDLPTLDIHAMVEVSGRSNPLVFPVLVELGDDNAFLIATGETTVRHADLGLKPFTAALGALRVRDQFILQYHIRAERMMTTDYQDRPAQ